MATTEEILKADQKKIFEEAEVMVDFPDLDSGGNISFSVRQAMMMHRELNKLFGDK